MTEQTKPVLKTYFTTGSKPTEAQFGDLIDTFVTETSAAFGNAATGTVVSNIAGVSANPANNTLSAVLDNVISGSQGALLFRGANVWQSLSPGTTGQLLASGGAGADVSWSTATGAGTVTSVSAGNGLTASTNPITTTGAIQLKDIPAQTIMVNPTTVSAAPVGTTLTRMIDSVVSGSQGSVLYRNATSWVALAPGTTGQVLTAGGVSANPSWAAAGGGWTSTFLTGDQTNLTTAYVAASGLSFNVASSANYSFRARLFFNTTNATGDFKYVVSGPATPVLIRYSRAHFASDNSAIAATINTAFSVEQITAVGSAGSGWADISGTLQNGANAGQITIKFALTGAAGTGTMYGGSVLEYATVQ